METIQKKPEVVKLFVGYRTRMADGIADSLPEFKAPANYKDKAKIADYINDAREAFLAEAKNMPHTGTFDEVALIDSVNQKTTRWEYAPPGSGKRPISVRLRNYLTKNYPGAWSNEVVGRSGQPSVVIVAFDPRTFLKILGLECSLPAIAKPCPPGLWYTNTDHRDMAEAIVPKEFAKAQSLPFILRLRRPVDPEAVAKWDALTHDWTGPGVNPVTDACICIELAAQLGFIGTAAEE